MTTATETKTRKTARRPAKTGNPAADREANTKAAANGKAEPQPTPAPEPKPKTVQELIREADQQVIVAAGQLIERLPREVRAEVAQAVANQLHHLSTPKLGWPGTLPRPNRSDWR